VRKFSARELRICSSKIHASREGRIVSQLRVQVRTTPRAAAELSRKHFSYEDQKPKAYQQRHSEGGCSSRFSHLRPVKLPAVQPASKINAAEPTATASHRQNGACA
jgi:hypothetical protein